MGLPHQAQMAEFVIELVALRQELPWLEFKRSLRDPEQTGAYLSALSNGAALAGRQCGYLVWGVEDKTFDLVGTDYDLSSDTIGAEPILAWLHRFLSPRIGFEHASVEIGGLRIVVVAIPAAVGAPTKWKRSAYIRLGSITKPLSEAPDLEGSLWGVLQRESFESRAALQQVDAERVLRLLNYQTYYTLINRQIPPNQAEILTDFCNKKLLVLEDTGRFTITNLAAILLAQSLEDFHALDRKGMRVIQYGGISRTDPAKDRVSSQGYATGIEGLMAYVAGAIPTIESRGRALRTSTPSFPEGALRELVINALLHQDFTVAGTGPMIELFHDRIEITNPGESLVPVNRIVDAQARSRNERLSMTARDLRMCEERGSGIDRVLEEVEAEGMPAPLFEVPPGSTRVTLFARRPFGSMTKEDRLRTAYFHACLQYVKRLPTTNQSLRTRLGLPYNANSTVSRLLAESVDLGLLTLTNPEEGTRNRKYAPGWAI